MTTATAVDLFAAIEAAEHAARQSHDAGTCAASEWSCSYCEEEARA